MNKLTSRKFWICVAAGLAAIATGIANAAIGNETVAAIGISCGIIAGGIYAACETAVDVTRLKSDTTITTNSITQSVEAKSDDVLTVAAVLAPATEQPVMEDE